MDAMAEVTPEELEIEQLARARRLRRGLRVAARRAIVLARRYRTEEGPGGAREAACVQQALRWRASAQALGNGATDLPRPGLARTTAPKVQGNRRTA